MFKKIIPFLTGINIIVVLVLINILLSFYPFLRIDLSQDKIHSLSKSTVKIIKDLDDVVNIKVYLTSDLPAEIKPISNDMKTILSELGRINKNKLKITYFDPSKNEEAKNEAQKLGIQPIQFSAVKNDKFEVSSGYFGLALTYGNKQEILPVAGDVGNLEYYLVAGIKRLTSNKIPTVAIAEENENSQVQYLRKFLGENYKIIDVKLDGEEKFPSEADSLVIIGRQNKVDDKGLNKIREWIKSGKGVVAFLDKTNVNDNMQGQKINDTGLEEIFKENGMEIQPKLVLDDSSALANFKTQDGAFLAQYPYWINILPENINKKIPCVSGISSLSLAWASPINISGNAQSLFTSSQKSTLDDNFSDLSPINKKIGASNNQKYTLGAINTNGVKIILIGDSDFIKDQFAVNNKQNFILAMNLVDYFSQDNSLLSIRSKSIKNSPLVVVNDTTKLIIKTLGIVLPILILVVSAFVTKIIRNKKNKEWHAEKK